MLISFKVSNFKSILEPVEFNMLTDSDDLALSQNLYEIKSAEEKVSPFSVIMGANGSGKSSIVEALNFVERYVIEQDLWDKPPRNKNAEENLPTYFEVNYYVENSYIGKPFQKFILEVFNDGSFHECLKFWENGFWQTVYESKKSCDFALDEDGYITAYIPDMVENIKYYDTKKGLVDFFNNLVIINSIDTIVDHTLLKYFGLADPTFNCATDKTSSDAIFLSGYICDQNVFKTEFIDFMNNLGINITDATFEEKEVARPMKAFPQKKERANEQAEEIIKKYCVFYNKDWVEHYFGDRDSDKTSITVYKLKSLRYQSYEVPIEEESSGTRRIVMIIYFILTLLLKDNSELVLFIDEMDAGLHDTLAKEIVDQYFDICKRRGRKCSQLIITSHNTVLMRDIPLRKDQIWFTEMKGDRTTDLFSLADIKDVKASEDFAENYLRGKYGALPQIKKWSRKSEE